MQDFIFIFYLSSALFNHALYLCMHIFVIHYFPFLSLLIQLKRKVRQYPPNNYWVQSARWELRSQLVLSYQKRRHTNLYKTFRYTFKSTDSQMFFFLSSSFSNSDFSRQSLLCNVYHTMKLFETKLPILINNIVHNSG